MTKYSKEWSGLSPEVRGVISQFQEEIPVKIGEVVKSFGVELKVSTLDIGISGMIFPSSDGHKIVINKHEPSYRQRFTLAHELAHFLLHRHLIGSGISDNILYRSKLSDLYEAEANRLASDILMPVEKVKELRAELAVERLADVVSPLAAKFGVSEEAMRIRLGMK
ncbi:ImmA/IrrE family metallo-endopeptidase [Neorhizobium sp. T786]|uniref:ImmA/IrrE family metallo-endopeptidase n=1 Tax=Pseudorhizobium xiangyangii TaxID=2883104 RepID=UPI001CFF97C3|nr:ImmA/IrrE family metallo-endopeptidase [Neorhizobium xiangyangii]MCB5200953.1 ImmA/IrrE family metallo-endopeptidase [Neorhizobium xiangyangii]